MYEISITVYIHLCSILIYLFTSNNVMRRDKPNQSEIWQCFSRFPYPIKTDTYDSQIQNNNLQKTKQNENKKFKFKMQKGNYNLNCRRSYHNLP